jgi:hypothetical protein
MIDNDKSYVLVLGYDETGAFKSCGISCKRQETLQKFFVVCSYSDALVARSFILCFLGAGTLSSLSNKPFEQGILTRFRRMRRCLINFFSFLSE